MAKTSSQRLHDAQQAMASIQRYVASEPLERLNDDLTRSAVERQLSIVQEALRVAVLQEPALRQSLPDLDAAMRRCARLRDWEDPVFVQELAGFVDDELRNWQGSCRASQAAAGGGGEVGSADCRESEEAGV